MLATGQILFKLGSSGKTLNGLLDVIKLLFSPVILLALSLYGATTLLWMYILNKVPMSFAYPIQALAFPVVLMISIYVFNESVSATKWIGISIILLGVFISTRG